MTFSLFYFWPDIIVCASAPISYEDIISWFYRKAYVQNRFYLKVIMYNVGMCLVLEHERPFGFEATSGPSFVVISQHIRTNETCLMNLVITIELLD